MPTSKIEVSSQAWTDLGTGPLFFHVGQRQNICLHIGVAAPLSDSQEYFDVTGPDERSYGGAEHVWVRAKTDTADVVVVTEAG